MTIAVCCPFCGSDHSDVVNVYPKRLSARLVERRRRRKCRACQEVFTTIGTEQVLGPVRVTTVAFHVSATGSTCVLTLST
jgi:transcriptional regulator NrdR family protein